MEITKLTIRVPERIKAKFDKQCRAQGMTQGEYFALLVSKK